MHTHWRIQVIANTGNCCLIWWWRRMKGGKVVDLGPWSKLSEALRGFHVTSDHQLPLEKYIWAIIHSQIAAPFSTFFPKYHLGNSFKLSFSSATVVFYSCKPPYLCLLCTKTIAHGLCSLSKYDNLQCFSEFHWACGSGTKLLISI